MLGHSETYTNDMNIIEYKAIISPSIIILA